MGPGLSTFPRGGGQGPATAGAGDKRRPVGVNQLRKPHHRARAAPRLLWSKLQDTMPTLRFFGHAACEVIDGDTRLLIDPFLTGNPLATVSPDDLDPTAILLSHGHNDHMGDALAIAR